jgi:hypothetical protein
MADCQKVMNDFIFSLAHYRGEKGIIGYNGPNGNEIHTKNIMPVYNTCQTTPFLKGVFIMDYAHIPSDLQKTIDPSTKHCFDKMYTFDTYSVTEYNLPGLNVALVKLDK